ncbi:Guanine nucleotide-binding protein subunit gamma 3 [Citrus sinensis]|nr:Guanine nucleotide-binding protein subunit gamma 3 [Citrus sinensis]
MDNACRSSLVESPMGPRSPPAAALDLYGKRRQMVKVQVLEREIGLLQEELKSVEDVQPASICCKEYVWLLCCIVVDDFVGAKPDPLVAIKQESHKPNPFWKSLWSLVKNGANAWDFHACTMHAAVSSLGTIVQR